MLWYGSALLPPMSMLQFQRTYLIFLLRKWISSFSWI